VRAPLPLLLASSGAKKLKANIFVVNAAKNRKAPIVTVLRNLPPRLRTIEQRSVMSPVKRAAPFYLTPAWKSLMRRLIAKRPLPPQE
jgi:hypothetical protein